MDMYFAMSHDKRQGGGDAGCLPRAVLTSESLWTENSKHTGLSTHSQQVTHTRPKVGLKSKNKPFFCVAEYLLF